MRDLYRILGIGRDAARDEIHRAYRRKAKCSHPDSGGSVGAFGELATAYAVLSNPLFSNEKTKMLFGDAKPSVEALVAGVKQA